MIRINCFSLATFLGLFLGSMLTASAQTGLVRGSISDAITGEALIQAAVIYGAGESSIGVLTDFDGLFSIELSSLSSSISCNNSPRL